MLNNNSTSNFQNNLIFKSINMQQKMQDRQVFEQFMSKPVIERVTADRPRGHLLHENLLQQFTGIFKDTATDAKNLGNALITGKSNDHELGRMNNLGMKIGGSIIAAALMGAKSTKNAKLMEVVGFSTFFSVMSLWPKIMIDLPTKLMHGFNPHQKYIDSQGRKKEFFQDNQYLPWDAWTKDDLNKVADKMNVPNNLADREEYTKEKMRKIALQDNTLWMLTAGFAAPLFTSLAGNRVEAGISGPIAQLQLRNLNNVTASSMQEASDALIHNSRVFADNDAAFKGLMDSLRRGEMPENFAGRLSQIFDLTGLCENQNVADSMRRTNANISQEFITRLFPTRQTVSDEFIREFTGTDDKAFAQAKDIFKKAIERVESQGNVRTLDSIFSAANDIAVEEITTTDHCWADDFYDFYQSFANGDRTAIKKAQSMAGEVCDKRTMEEGANVLETIYNNSVKPAQANLRVFGEKLAQLGNVSGDNYNKTTREFVKILGFNYDEIRALNKRGKSFGTTFEDQITAKIQSIVQDKDKLEKALKRLEKIEKKYTTASNVKGEKITIKGIFEKLVSGLNENMDKSAKAITNSAAEAGSELSQQITNAQGAFNTSTLNSQLMAGLQGNEQLGARANITSVESVIAKLKSALSLEEKIQDGTMLRRWQDYISKNPNLQSLAETQEETIYSKLRYMVWQSNYADAVNKFYMDGNGDLFEALTEVAFRGDMSDDAINIWKAQARLIAQNADSIPFPATVFQKGVTTLDEVISEMTKMHCEASGIQAENLTEEIKNLIKQKAELFIKSEGEVAQLTHKTKFAQYGESILSTCKKQIENVYNDRHWMRVFGGVTIALIGITILSQLFFGRMKDAHLYKKKETSNNNTQDTFVNGRK